MARIEDYALISDCNSAALVSRQGSIDWLCWPRFDSGACFASLLGKSDHGCWRVAPGEAGFESSRAYLGPTMVLVTTFRTSAGVAELIDFLVPGAPEPTLVRIVRGVEGEVDITSELVVRFDYGLTVPWVARGPNRELLATAGPLKLVFRTAARSVGRNMRTLTRFKVAKGEQVAFTLQCVAAVAEIPRPCDADAALEKARDFWTAWAAKCRDDNPWYDLVQRSLLTLKALTFTHTGGIVAAPTTSLPERIGGPRNWDYRFCWLRDSSLTLQALMTAGYWDEAMAWRDWLVRAVAGAPQQAQIMYGVSGERFLDERELPWLPGYERSKPVRIGNGASNQFQLDVYGEVIDVLHRTGAHLESQGSNFRRKTPPAMQVALAVLEHVEAVWREPDEGIWEVRGPPRHFVHSKIMAWVAFDRAVKGLARLGDRFPVERWSKLRDEAHAEICARGYDPKVGAFMQYYGADALDASVLLAPLVGFLPADDPRIVGTVRAIEQRLLKGGLMLRYEQPDASTDGLPPGEGAFLACSFWYVDVLVLQGRIDEARATFERLIALCNDVGLLAEEYDPVAKRMLGNFPQAFSHVGLANSAYRLAAALQPAGRQAAAKG
ncbi:MAG TPA: glycoside hydrolase family 15 protein [Roseiarcus sp.]|nr:glycoside hydrolase family 15 protein [Roseiarcus sp.]